MCSAVENWHPDLNDDAHDSGRIGAAERIRFSGEPRSPDFKKFEKRYLNVSKKN
jgi:hypothetical protein